MIRLNGEDLRALGRAMLTAVGVAYEEAELVADHLVESGLLGHDTHSVLRLPQYVNMVRDGVVDPSGQLLVRDGMCTEQGGRWWCYGCCHGARLQPHSSFGSFRHTSNAPQLHCSYGC